MDRNKFPQCIRSLQAHAPVGVLQGFGKGGLKLRQEGLQGNSNLREKPIPKSHDCGILTT